jgi:hypothetical protein
MTEEKKKPGRPPKAKPKAESKPEVVEEKQPESKPEVAEPQEPKTLNTSPDNPATELVQDIEKYGDPDKWKLICKASSQAQGWMKSTKAMDIPGYGCLVQVSEQQGDQLSTSITPIQGVGVYPSVKGGYRLCGHTQFKEPEA